MGTWQFNIDPKTVAGVHLARRSKSALRSWLKLRSGLQEWALQAEKKGSAPRSKQLIVCEGKKEVAGDGRQKGNLVPCYGPSGRQGSEASLLLLSLSTTVLPPRPTEGINLLCKLHAILIALTRLSKLLASLWGREWPCRLLWQMWGVSPLHSLHPGLSLCSFTDHTLQNLVHCPTRPLRGPPLSSALRVMLHSLILRSQAHLSESFADSSYKVRCVPMLLCSFSYLSPWICFLLCWVSPSLDWKLLKGECPVHFHYYCHLGTQTPGSVIQ
jgi:hypothetical protein